MLVIPHVDKDVVERLELGPPLSEVALVVAVLGGTEKIKEEGIISDVVLCGDVWHDHGLDYRLVFREVLVVGVGGMVLCDVT